MAAARISFTVAPRGRQASCYYAFALGPTSGVGRFENTISCVSECVSHKIVELEGEEPRAQTREGGRKSAGIRGGLSKECKWEYHVRVNRALGHVSFGYDYTHRPTSGRGHVSIIFLGEGLVSSIFVHKKAGLSLLSCVPSHRTLLGSLSSTQFSI